MYGADVLIATTPRVQRLGPLVRLVVLTLFALFATHDAIYLARFGANGSYAAAMSAGGHDGYYLPASLAITIAAAIVALVALARLSRLTGRGNGRSARAGVGSEQGVSVQGAGSGYLREFRRIWPGLLGTVAVLFVLQENAEALGSGQPLPGLGVLFGQTSGLVLPILAITTFLLAALGAVVRWRTRLLLARHATNRPSLRPRSVGRSRARLAACASIPHAWMIDRLDAGRAPPPLPV